MASCDKLNVSLEPHLLETLLPLQGVLPTELSDELTSYLSSGQNARTIPIIPYECIQRVSRWCRTSDGRKALQNCSPSLDPQSYTMVSLLAGVRTSPEKHFPPYMAEDPEEERRRISNDRKAISTLVNSVLSIAGTGVATWWASGHTGLKVEWRTMSAMCAALVVAFAEVVLYMIWDSRRSSQPLQPSRQRRVLVTRKKGVAEKDGEVDIPPQASSTGFEGATLRHRIGAAAAEPTGR
ncbi:hypothetical protein PAXRUDRAFT_821334 [Paxillus rubicundulus Ve08.2h10]|uniref:Endoplasmic reticulum-based factor for assembly of V-ATPase n=1 Tax=Paxillus rubicundulus Ve08.2h10 TaxID=930991 RepID=A0A0D0E6P2_9AGAM|nr:hypothetical protein PAXRUDRAFT_821334 [Paxillus rubicundulus Ve08.2h10]